MSGLFGDMFDFDHDGEMDSFEKAAEFNFWKTFWMMRETNEKQNITIVLMTKTKTRMKMSTSNGTGQALSFINI